jgi:L-alanine-DL-glutamate epimerase-like enolase superfamily enzyme
MEWSIEKLRLNLKYTWKISRNSSAYKENFVVRCKLNGYVGMGEIAPNIRYQETAEGIINSFENSLESLSAVLPEPNSLANFLQATPLPNALKFGIQAAFTHAYCASQGISLHTFLGIPKPAGVASCYTLPIMELGDIAPFYKTHHLHRFKQIKIKVDNAAGLDLIKEVQSLGANQIMIDANEAWTNVEALIAFIESIEKLPILFVEQPMPAALEVEYRYLKKHSNLPIMADESVLAEPNFDAIEKQFHGVNMKLMKAGSYQNGVRILQEARKRNMLCMVGCMVESTLGIKSAWDLCALADYADLDGCLIVDNEPYHLLHEEGGTFYEVAK